MSKYEKYAAPNKHSWYLVGIILTENGEYIY